MVSWGIIFQPTTELRAGPQSIAMLKVWGEEKEPAREYEKERSRRWEESQESVVSWRLKWEKCPKMRQWSVKAQDERWSLTIE